MASPGDSQARTSERLWQALTTPSPGIKDPRDRRRARLLASLIIPILPLAVLVTILRLVIDSGFLPSFVTVVGMVFLGLLYLLSRTRYFQAAVIGTVAIFPVSILLSVVFNFNADSFTLLLPYLAVGIIVASMLLGVRGVAVLGVIDIAGILALPLVRDELTFTLVVSPATLLILVVAVVLVSMIYRDRVERERRHALEESERKHRESASLLAQIMNSVPEGVLHVDRRGEIIDTNPIAREYLTALGTDPVKDVVTRVPQESTQSQHDGWTEAQSVHSVYELAARQLRPESASSDWVVVIRDVTHEREMQRSLEQRDRLAGIGQLAGGIAHDFNNILVPIIGYIDLVLAELPEDHAVRTNLIRVGEAAERAAALTRQILAFSRKQMLNMQQLDLNQVVLGFEDMLRRLIEEDITLVLDLEPSLPPVRADQGQIEQILMNLAVNARDAMPSGGKLVIETGNVGPQAISMVDGTETRTGPHVLFKVSDTGHGMDAATADRVFEPFFTTKERGRGTGLGLSTVFGIVKQHGGQISLYSQPDLGTSFSIYLPSVSGTAVANPGHGAPERAVSGSEAILVVEDEDLVRRLVCDTLAANGYRVLEAAGPGAAVSLAGADGITIDLLLTDVVMPGLNGPQLFERISETRDDLKVLYMSGYSNDVIANHGFLEERVDLLEKPFTISALLEAVRHSLEGGGSQPDS